MGKSKVLVLFTMIVILDGSLSLVIDKTSCGTAKNCYSEPADCSSSMDCDYLLTISTNGLEKVTFELSTKKQWAAVGLSDDNKMSKTDVLLCFRKGDGSVDAGHYWADGYGTPEKTQQGTAALTVLNAEYNSGVLSCRLSRPIRPGIENMRDLDDKWFLLYARGDVANDQIDQHSDRSSSPDRVNLTMVNVLRSSTNRKPVLVAHGALLIVAWLGFASVGMFIARYMRSAWNKKVFGKDIWFQVHRTLMFLTVLATITGIILAFYFKDGEWSANAGAHPILGIIVLVLAVLQPVIAIFRPHPGENRRWLFNWVHRSIGFSALVLAVATVFLGVRLPILDTKEAGLYVMIVYCAFAFIVVVTLEIYTLMKNNRTGMSQSIPMKTYSGAKSNGHTDDIPSLSMSNEEKVGRKFALALTILVVSGLATALIILIAIQRTK